MNNWNVSKVISPKSPEGERVEWKMYTTADGQEIYFPGGRVHYYSHAEWAVIGSMAIHDATRMQQAMEEYKKMLAREVIGHFVSSAQMVLKEYKRGINSAWDSDEPMPIKVENTKDVHTEHCCHHGCKYGEDDVCSVACGKRQGHCNHD